MAALPPDFRDGPSSLARGGRCIEKRRGATLVVFSRPTGGAVLQAAGLDKLLGLTRELNARPVSRSPLAREARAERTERADDGIRVSLSSASRSAAPLAAAETGTPARIMDDAAPRPTEDSARGRVDRDAAAESRAGRVASAYRTNEAGALGRNLRIRV